MAYRKATFRSRSLRTVLALSVPVTAAACDEGSDDQSLLDDDAERVLPASIGTGFAMVIDLPAYNGWDNPYEGPSAGTGAYGKAVFYDFIERAKIELAVAAALGVREVRFIIAPRFAGFVLQRSPGAAAIVDHEVVSVLANEILPDVVRSCLAMGLRPNFQFLTHEIHTTGPAVVDGQVQLSSPSVFYPDADYPHRHYDLSYAALGESGPAQLGEDLAGWMNTIIDTVDTEVPGGVSYWGIYPEVPTTFTTKRAPEQLLSDAEVGLGVAQALARHLHITHSDPGRVSIGPFEAHGSAPLAAALWAEGVAPGHAFLSIYPEASVNADVAGALGSLLSAFPGAQPDLDFGVDACATGSTGQVDAVDEKFHALNQQGVSHVFQWFPFDSSGATCATALPSRFGFGSSIDEPRPLLGWASERGSALPGGDFEADASGWEVWSGGTSTLTQRTWGGATGPGFLRLEATSPGTYEVCSPEFGLVGNRGFVHAYLRGGSQRSVRLHTRDARGATWQEGLGPLSLSLPDMPWGMLSIQALAGASTLDLPAGTVGARLCFQTVASAATSESSPHIFDIDTVAVSAADGLALDGGLVHRVSTTGTPTGGGQPGAGAPPATCECRTDVDNFCSYGASAPGCAMTAPGGYCDPNADGSTLDAQWVQGWQDFQAVCGSAGTWTLHQDCRPSACPPRDCTTPAIGPDAIDSEIGCAAAGQVCNTPGGNRSFVCSA